MVCCKGWHGTTLVYGVISLNDLEHMNAWLVFAVPFSLFQISIVSPFFFLHNFGCDSLNDNVV